MFLFLLVVLSIQENVCKRGRIGTYDIDSPIHFRSNLFYLAEEDTSGFYNFTISFGFNEYHENFELKIFRTPSFMKPFILDDIKMYFNNYHGLDYTFDDGKTFFRIWENFELKER